MLLPLLLNNLLAPAQPPAPGFVTGGLPRLHLQWTPAQPQPSAAELARRRRRRQEAEFVVVMVK